MGSRTGNVRCLRFLAGFVSCIANVIVPISVVVLSGSSALADGCFVFRWNKAVDINEPTQKAIIVFDQGREDILLQVKYEGPLEDFGWLVPVPSLPTVEKGSMEPFYELSELTQRQFGVLTKSLSHRGGSGGGIQTGIERQPKRRAGSGTRAPDASKTNVERRIASATD